MGPDQLVRTDLAIDGMTCASCAARVEKGLNQLDGVSATVNFATEHARVEAPATVSPDDLIAVVEGVGYGARVPTPAHAHGQGEAAGHEHDHGDEAGLRTRLLVSTALAVPVILMAMVP